MDVTVFQALAEPSRLRIVELLRERPHAVNEIADALGLPQPQVSKHLRTLNDAGMVRVYAIAQQRYYGLRPEPLRDVDAWVAAFQPFWDTRSSILDRYMRSRPGGTAPRTSAAETAPVTVERVIDAPRARVWDAWTDPTLALQWWGPEYFTTPRFEIDVRPDGELRIDIQAPDGTVFPMTGVVKEAAEPERLVFIATPLDEAGNRLFEVLHTVRFMAESSKTRLSVEARVFFAGPDAAPYLAGMEAGWQQSLAKLDRSLGGERPSRSPRRGRKHDGERTR
jgi:uncharacterized protein YndB with AHSA1/START domain/DNA-binding transcriptional ArsR family regulator